MSEGETSDLVERCENVGSDMLRSVPAGGDVYMIKRVMMDHTDSDAKAILRNCLSGMNSWAKYSLSIPCCQRAMTRTPIG
jgi:O-methyltransferase domain